MGSTYLHLTIVILIIDSLDNRSPAVPPLSLFFFFHSTTSILGIQFIEGKPVDDIRMYSILLHKVHMYEQGTVNSCMLRAAKSWQKVCLVTKPLPSESPLHIPLMQLDLDTSVKPERKHRM